MLPYRISHRYTCTTSPLIDLSTLIKNTLVHTQVNFIMENHFHMTPFIHHQVDDINYVYMCHSTYSHVSSLYKCLLKMSHFHVLALLDNTFTHEYSHHL